MFRFENFPVYKETKIFVKDIYKLAANFPKQEQFELASQLRRATTSILLNIALDQKYVKIDQYQEIRQKLESIIKQLYGFSRLLKSKKL